MSNTKPKIIFAPGCFDQFDGTQEELDALIKEIQQGFESGDFLDKATPVDLDELDDETLDALASQMNLIDDNDADRKLH